MNTKLDTIKFQFDVNYKGINSGVGTSEACRSVDNFCDC